MSGAGNGLQQQIEAGRQTIKAESYGMSIGELVSLYTRSELIIRPEFQRLFRWTIAQKSRLIESIMLGIPLPSIFVLQREDGVWEVIDGLQRISTILEFMGELKSPSGSSLVDPSVLVATEYLPSLQGRRYGSDAAGVEDQESTKDEDLFTPGQRLSFKRAKIDVKILLPESDTRSKYELFDRLNAGGSPATAQEIRNAQLILRDPTMFQWLEDLRNYPAYQSTLSLSDRLYDEGYDAELVYRHFALMNTEEVDWRAFNSMDEFISNQVFRLASDESFERDKEKERFESLFDMLNASVGEDAFRKYDSEGNRFLGGFSVSAFESISVGVARSIEYWSGMPDPSVLRDRVSQLWSNSSFRTGSGSGIRASTRVPKTLPAAIEHFSG